MRDLFSHFFFFGQCAYPLFGTKPMSFTSFPLTNSTETGWSAWLKISHHFYSEKIVIRDFYNGEQKFVLFANLEEVEKTYLENRQLFEPKIELETLKICLRQGGARFEDLMKDRLLLGILLGYGTKNSERFVADPKNLEPFCSIHPIFYWLSPVMPVYFACDPTSDETKALKIRYTKERNTILNMARSEDLFTWMLFKLKNDQAFKARAPMGTGSI